MLGLGIASFQPMVVRRAVNSTVHQRIGGRYLWHCRQRPGAVRTGQVHWRPARQGASQLLLRAEPSQQGLNFVSCNARGRFCGLVFMPSATRDPALACDRLRSGPGLDGCGERKGTMHPGINTETHADEIAQLLGTGGVKRPARNCRRSSLPVRLERSRRPAGAARSSPRQCPRRAAPPRCAARSPVPVSAEPSPDRRSGAGSTR